MEDLKNKPLVEAILELKWAIPPTATDPHYKFLLGRFYDKIITEYPEHEQLPAVNIPEDMVQHIVQHRFRKAKNEWPLLQLGPGIITINETEKYKWPDFRSRSIDFIKKFFESYPKIDDLKVESLLLRYIDAIEFDFVSDDILKFLKEKMRVEFILPPELFSSEINKTTKKINWLTSYECSNPKGAINLRFASGLKDATPALIWETVIHSTQPDLPRIPEDFQEWLDAAHNLTDFWFATLIKGELKKRFSGE